MYSRVSVARHIWDRPLSDYSNLSDYWILNKTCISIYVCRYAFVLHVFVERRMYGRYFKIIICLGLLGAFKPGLRSLFILTQN